MQTTDIPPDQIRPVLDQVLVVADLPKDTTDGGLVIPEASQHQSDAARGVDFGMGKGTVLSVGPGRRGRKGKRVRIPPALEPGDRILYRRFSGRELKHEGREYRIVHEEDVFAVIEGEG